MNILITGGTGFVGEYLTTHLNEQGHHVYVLTRNPSTHTNSEKTTYIHYQYPVEKLPSIQTVINLAGDSLFGYWTKSKKERILTSRVHTTQTIIQFIRQMKTKPEVFISASAVGYYGTSDDIIFTEKTAQPGNDFLSNVTVNWENTARQAELLGIRTVYARFGVILGDKGALPLMSLPIKMFAGGNIGTGEQWISWIHVQDAVKLIVFCMTNKQITGPINFTAPYPKRNKDFTKTLAKTLKRPYWFTTPSPLMRIALGEMAQLITNGQYVLPQKALDHHYQFSWPNLAGALEEIVSN